MSSYRLKPKYIFGKDAMEQASIELKKYNFKKAVILYGKGSIKTNGIYNDVVNALNNAKIEHVEFEGIEPNPRDTTIYKASLFCRENDIDLILAVGGGSVIDASKVIGILANNPVYEDTWSYVLNQSKVTKPCIPIVAVITLAGTASENNAGSVVTNEITREKTGVFTPTGIPFLCVENPKYTFSVNPWQTASGIFDCFSHLLEQYFGKATFEWTKEYIFANLKTLLKYAKTCILKPDHYIARANVLWTTSMSLNSTASFLSDSDWSVHSIEHGFSGLWDITHGAGLALITPVYLDIRSKKEKWFEDKLIELGRNVFKTNTREETIKFIRDFIDGINLPSKWTQFKEIKSFTDDNVEFLVKHTVSFSDRPELKELYREVIETIKNNI